MGGEFAITGVFAILLLLLAGWDIVARVIPNRLVYPGAVFALAAAPFLPADSYVGALIGGAIVLTLLALVHLWRSDAIGLGDVKLGALIGLALGFPGGLMALFAGALLGGVAAAVALATGRIQLRSTIAYGPYLCAGALTVIILGTSPPL